MTQTETGKLADESSPNDIRALGWTVAVHNDYRIGGKAHTFWLFVRGDRAIKGEGPTDADALNEIRAALRTPPTGKAMREAFRKTLKEHWITAVKCDHEAHTDMPICYCCERLCDPQPTLGDAVDRWIDHALAEFEAAIGYDYAALAQPQEQREDVQPVALDELQEVCAEAYQVVGTLLSDAGQFDTEHGTKILDNLSEGRLVHKDILPWSSIEKAAPPPLPDSAGAGGEREAMQRCWEEIANASNRQSLEDCHAGLVVAASMIARRMLRETGSRPNNTLAPLSPHSGKSDGRH